MRRCEMLHTKLSNNNNFKIFTEAPTSEHNNTNPLMQ